uniref:Uncharacterized protein n=1 Tax=Candidatus Kentrum sp. LPFa TaxID=2126335 RepID=A0A450W6I6_9GAMM|nr:MAG: hypothetical protein BECKLPF1236B_GA0070989_103912 [Candidatus Kentron sp. LPFa]
MIPLWKKCAPMAWRLPPVMEMILAACAPRCGKKISKGAKWFRSPSPRKERLSRRVIPQPVKQSSIMPQTLYATYDGHVFTPEKEVDLLPNRRYSIRIEMQPEQKPEPKKKILRKLSERAMDLGVSDLAAQHDHYLYGTEKR